MTFIVLDLKQLITSLRLGMSPFKVKVIRSKEPEIPILGSGMALPGTWNIGQMLMGGEKRTDSENTHEPW